MLIKSVEDFANLLIDICTKGIVGGHGFADGGFVEGFLPAKVLAKVVESRMMRPVFKVPLGWQRHLIVWIEIITILGGGEWGMWANK